jgi:hypothetical protein
MTWTNNGLKDRAANNENQVTGQAGQLRIADLPVPEPEEHREQGTLPIRGTCSGNIVLYISDRNKEKKSQHLYITKMKYYKLALTTKMHIVHQQKHQKVEHLVVYIKQQKL